jgi:hypothetical protein
MVMVMRMRRVWMTRFFLWVLLWRESSVACSGERSSWFPVLARFQQGIVAVRVVALGIDDIN